jgi:hypothetical protein
MPHHTARVGRTHHQHEVEVRADVVRHDLDHVIDQPLPDDV